MSKMAESLYHHWSGLVILGHWKDTNRSSTHEGKQVDLKATSGMKEACGERGRCALSDSSD